jgi:small subunit ribosomal protein S16
MVTIRLSRGGSKRAPFYHIDVKDSRTSRDGRYIERLGFFNPNARGAEQRLAVDLGRATHWLGVGAATSPRVKSLMKEAQKQAAV